MCMCRSARHFDRFAFLNFLHCLQALLLTNPCTVIKRGLMRSHLVQAEVVRPTGQITFETNFIRSQRCTRSLLERSKTSMQTSSRESVCIEDCKSIAYHDRRFVFQWWLACCYLPLYTCMIMYLFIYLFIFFWAIQDYHSWSFLIKHWPNLSESKRWVFDVCIYYWICHTLSSHCELQERSAHPVPSRWRLRWTRSCNV